MVFCCLVPVTFRQEGADPEEQLGGHKGSDGTGGPNGSSIQVYSGGSLRKINKHEPLPVKREKFGGGWVIFYLWMEWDDGNKHRGND